MRFRHHDSLRLFASIAEHGSFSAAAAALNLTKGAVSYQVHQLEEALGFALFHRRPRGIELTDAGRELRASVQTAFEDIERKIERLRSGVQQSVTLGLSTYLASRWLSPRLMTFMQAHPDIRLRLQPMVDLVDLRGAGVDLAIRWGKGDWPDLELEPLFPCPAFPTGAPGLAARIERDGLTAVFARTPLLIDREGSSAWADWHAAAGLSYLRHGGALAIPDPNVLVQAVIDGQGIALNDALVSDEITAGKLARLSPIELADYGYFIAYAPGALADPCVAALVGWLHEQAALMH
ncbi:LysR family transcriptional regulator [Pelagibius litoralis]|uniref:LysR family transcriptional regulator n=1 Tax=Pelagibius litoralis TaxID=374515 RepID=A0A967F2B3_9PROT|nr:LysR substrate-binding domain-containing protein [Pelagibius litoralis]NIA71702.1 LysR family transcriptional regulator [Pelagibius litoralis]